VIYDDEEKAFLRAEAVRLQGKWWPGVIRHRDGTFTLTYDPLDDAGALPDMPSAPFSELGIEQRYRSQHEPRGSLRDHGRPAGPLYRGVLPGLDRRIP
jgi:hypothetical protein